MKKTSLTMLSVIFIPLLFLQLSCATAGKQQTGKTVSNVKKGSGGSLFLADKHKTSGVECNDCHKETPPADEVPAEVCQGCHENYKELTKSDNNPHDAHLKYAACGDCHHAHKASENQCLACHSFNVKTP
jgi:hypothetical protein